MSKRANKQRAQSAQSEQASAISELAYCACGLRLNESESVKHGEAIFDLTHPLAYDMAATGESFSIEELLLLTVRNFKPRLELTDRAVTAGSHDLLTSFILSHLFDKGLPRRVNAERLFNSIERAICTASASASASIAKVIDAALIEYGATAKPASKHKALTTTKREPRT